MEFNVVTFSRLLLDTKDGDWGKGEAHEGFLPYRVIRGTDFSEAKNGELSNVPIRYLPENSVQRRTLQAGDIIIETAGGSNDYPTGRTFLVKRELIEQSDLPLTCASFCRFLRVNPELANSTYIYWYLQYLYARGDMWIHQVKHTGIARFQYTRFASSVQVPLPPLPEQQAIGHILSSLDAKIELNRQMNETLEDIARSLFKAWFVDFDPVRAKMEGRQPYGMDAETAELFPNGFKDSRFGNIPIGWNYSSLEELFSDDERCVLTGPFGSLLHASDYSPMGIPLILVKHVNHGRILEEDMPLITKAKVDELSRYQLKEKDIVFTRVGAVGRSAYVYARQIGWLISGQMLRVRIPNHEILHSRYLAQVYSSSFFIEMVEQHALGTTRPSLNTSLLKTFKFLVPPIILQNYYVQLINSLDEKLQYNLAEIQTLSALRDTLLPKLLSGEIRVRDAEKEVEAAL